MKRSQLLKYKKILLTLGMITTTSLLNGCGNQERPTNTKKEYLLQDTILDNHVIAKINGSYIIVKLETPTHKHNHYHYTDIITGLKYADIDDDMETCFNEFIYIEKPELKNISYYLTKEDINKCINGNLTEEEIVNIVYKINTKINEENFKR